METKTLEQKIKSLQEKIQAIWNGGDNQKLERFLKKVAKTLQQQIKLKQDEIEKLDEKIDDAKEVLKETVTDIKGENINTSDSAQAQADAFIINIRNKRNAVKKLELQKEDLLAEIEEIQADEEAIFGSN